MDGRRASSATQSYWRYTRAMGGQSLPESRDKFIQNDRGLLKNQYKGAAQKMHNHTIFPPKLTSPIAQFIACFLSLQSFLQGFSSSRDVPEGSILGPLLFVFISLLSPATCLCFLQANDVKPFLIYFPSTLRLPIVEVRHFRSLAPYKWVGT